MKLESSLNLTRRSFIIGGAATLGAAGLGLAGCKSKSGSVSDEDAPIKAAIAYPDTMVNPVGQATAMFYAAGLHVYEGLYEIDYHTYKTYNGLAALTPTKINDYTYDVVLRDGAKFSNGVDVKAEDVVNSFQKNMKDETYLPLLDFIKSVSVKDSKTVTFTLNYAFESLLQDRLAIVRVFPASLSDDELKKMPIGSGPYAYKAINGNDGGKVEFIKNEYYNGKYPAVNNTMEWNVMADDTSRTTALSERSVHVIESVPDSNVDQLHNSGASVDYVQSFSCPLAFFNCLKAPWDDYRVRQAFMYALDYDKMIDNSMMGHATAATSFLPKNHANYHRATTVFTHNQDKARELLKAAGLDKLSLKLLVHSSWVKTLAPQIKNDLDAVGIETTLDVQKVNWASITDYNGVPAFDVLITGGDPTQKGNDPDLIINTWLGDNVWTKGRTCWKRAANTKFPELQDLLLRARQASGTAQQTLWNNCYDIIAEQCPTYPLFHREVATGYLPDKITDFRPISTTGLDFLGASAAAI